LSVVWFRRLQLSERLAGVREELHLRQVRAQRVGRRRNRGNRGVACFLGCLSRVLGGTPKLLAFLSEHFELLAVLFAKHSGLLGEYPELLRLCPCRFRHHAVLFGAATFVVRFLPQDFSHFASRFGRDGTQLTGRLVVGHGGFLVFCQDRRGRVSHTLDGHPRRYARRLKKKPPPPPSTSTTRTMMSSVVVSMNVSFPGWQVIRHPTQSAADIDGRLSR
jgi:hypothetical protein